MFRHRTARPRRTRIPSPLAVNGLLLLIGFLIGCTRAAPEPRVVAESGDESVSEPSEETYSENRTYSVVISETAPAKRPVTVFKHDGETRQVAWSHLLVETKGNSFPYIALLGDFRKWVLNDGSKVILRPVGDQTADEPLIYVVSQDGSRTKFDVTDLLRVLEATPDAPEDAENFSSGTGDLDLLVEDEQRPYYGYWDAGSRSWGVLDLTTLKVVAADSARTERLNALGLVKTREIVRQHQSGSVVSESPFQARNGIENRAEAAYRFLATQRHPEDRKEIEALLQDELTRDGRNSGTGSPRIRTNWEKASAERALGEKLLAAWDNTSKPEEPIRDTTENSRPVSEWVIKTNQNPGGLRLTHIRVVEPAKKIPGDPPRQLEVRFEIPPPRPREMYMFDVQLVDEHGCQLQGMSLPDDGPWRDAEFSILPYGAKTFTLELVAQTWDSHDTLREEDAQRAKMTASFVLTNFFQTQPEVWQAENLPVERRLDLVTVELKTLSAETIESWPEMPEHFLNARTAKQEWESPGEVVFKKNGRAAPEWRKQAGWFADRWGNRSRSANDFCKLEKTLKYSVRAVRDPRRGQFAANEKWEIPVAAVPKAGQSLPLSLTNSIEGATIVLYNLGGTGEFTYRQGLLRGAEEEETAPIVYQDGHFRIPETPLPHDKRFYLKQLLEPMQTFGGGSKPWYSVSLDLITKAPHVSCRISDDGYDRSIELLERNVKIVLPMNAPRREFHGPLKALFDPRRLEPSPYHLLPLDLRPGAKGQKITFLVQRPRLAEFFVQVDRQNNSN